MRACNDEIVKLMSQLACSRVGAMLYDHVLGGPDADLCFVTRLRDIATKIVDSERPPEDT